MSKSPTPKWVVVYRTNSKNSPWFGTAWEFFDDDEDAFQRYIELLNKEMAICKRPFSESDKKLLSAKHMFES